MKEYFKLSIGRKNELSVGGKDLYIQLIRYRNDWSIYKKYKLRDCRIIKEKNIYFYIPTFLYEPFAILI